MTSGVQGNTPSSHIVPSNAMYSVADLFAAVKAYDKDFQPSLYDKNFQPNQQSKIVDDDGNPLVVYHGTNANFTVFDSTKTRSRMDIQGMFFSPWEVDAAGYGQNVRGYYLNVKNPASEAVAYRVLNRYRGDKNAGAKARTALIRMGADQMQDTTLLL